MGKIKEVKIFDRLQTDAAARAESRPDIRAIVEARLAQARPAQDINLMLKVLKVRQAKQSKNFSALRKRNKEEEKRLAQLTEGQRKIREDRQQLKAAAQAALLVGYTVTQVAHRYNVPEGVVAGWKDSVDVVSSVGRRDHLNDILMAYIEQEIKSLMTISIITEEEDWVLRQDASELATYVAVKSDRVFGLLQAYGRATQNANQYVNQLEVIAQEAD